MTNPNIERLLREIAREQEREEEYLLDRIKQLEQLCRDLYLIYMEEVVDYAGFTARMNDLGIGIEGRTRLDGE